VEKGSILIVDDNKNALRALSMLLQSKFENIVTISNPNQIVSELEQNDFAVVLLDMNFSAGNNTGNEGLFWLRELKKHSPTTEVIMITAYGDVELAVRALKLGATDFILKPWENEKLLATIHSAFRLREKSLEIDQLKKREQGLMNEIRGGAREIIGNSPEILKIKRLISKVAKTDASVLITGENGTGKELVAREIHRKSDRNKELMVTVDIGAIPESLFESEIFGHKKGAFTGAMEDRTGKFQLAHKGTLFLDEIGNLPFSLQAKLLLTLENRTVVALGSNKEIKIDIRLISATNSDTEELLATGEFREDLLYRLNTIHIEVPPLRERSEDIEILTTYFLKILGKKYNKSSISINSQAIRKLSKHYWPGNVRELLHTVEKAVILAGSDILKPDDFVFRTSARIFKESNFTLDEMEKQMIQSALDRQNGNLTAVANQLGITRQTLYNKIRKFDIG